MADFEWYCGVWNGCRVFTVLFRNKTRFILDSAKICDKSLQFWTRASHSKFPSFKSLKQNICDLLPFLRCFIHYMTVFVDKPERNQNLSIVTNTHRKETTTLRNATNTNSYWNGLHIFIVNRCVSIGHGTEFYGTSTQLHVLFLICQQ